VREREREREREEREGGSRKSPQPRGEESLKERSGHTAGTNNEGVSYGFR
jgi:hypothetical protein